MTPVPIVVARGDGIGPEITDATLRILGAAGAEIEPVTVDVGRALYLAGEPTGIASGTWAELERCGVMLKGPIDTPFGGGYKSLNVTLRKRLGLSANVRPVRAYAPYVETLHPDLDVVVVRENEEDLYAGIEYRQSTDVVQAIKLISRPGCERICRYAFDYARANGRSKVTCMIKDNIMKQTDGLFWAVCQEISAEYPEIELERYIVDIGMARVAADPTRFDVIVTENLYGDILSDITAELSGSVGLGGSANVGERFAMFEAIHGSAPDIAGQGIANPSGILHAAIMMLVHLSQRSVAERIHNAWLVTLENGVHTGDIAGERTRERVGTDGFADAVIQRLGRTPSTFSPVSYPADSPAARVVPISYPTDVDRRLIGIDVFVTSREVAPVLRVARAIDDLRVETIASRGVAVTDDATGLVDQLQVRFVGDSPTLTTVLTVPLRLAEAGLDVTRTEHLYDFDGQPGYSRPQGA